MSDDVTTPVSKLERAILGGRAALGDSRLTDSSEEGESVLREALEALLDALVGEPGSSGHMIDEMWAWVVLDPEDGNEGIPAAPIGGMVMPLVGADADRMIQFREEAQLIANLVGQPMILRRFSQATDLDTLEPSA